MGDLSKFFKESEGTLGVFHPKDYTIATFPTFAAAKAAYDSLLLSGLGKDEVMLANGQEMLLYFKQFREGEGLWGNLMRDLSRFIGTEANNSDLNIVQAQDGAGFLAIYTPTEERALRDMAIMKPFAPSSADWYLWGGIRSLI